VRLLVLDTYLETRENPIKSDDRAFGLLPTGPQSQQAAQAAPFSCHPLQFIESDVT